MEVGEQGEFRTRGNGILYCDQIILLFNNQIVLNLN